MNILFKTNMLALTVASTLLGMLTFSGDAIAARKVCDNGSYPPCNTEGESATNNLSVPTFVIRGGGLTNITCATDTNWPAIVPPTGTPKDGYPVSPLDYYFVQGVNKWQAPCATWDATAMKVPVTAAWGDNLTGDAKLKAGSPIRVELVLSYDSIDTVDGYEVVKLFPDALDRESSYGTLAMADGLGGWEATPSQFVPLVYDQAAWLNIVNNTGFEVDEAATAEINATGKVVYGYNLRVPTAGTYQITYTLPNVDIQSADAGFCSGQTCTLLITVTGGGGSGGGKRK